MANMRTAWICVGGLVSVAACGADDGALPDARDGVVDASAAADAVPVGPVRVTVYQPFAPGVPASDAAIVAAWPDGTVVEARTDAAGVVDLEVPAGAAITASVDGPVRVLQSLLAVAPGDDLVLGSPYTPLSTASTQLDVSWTTADPLRRTQAYAGCGQADVVAGTTTATLVMPARCLGGQTVLVTQVDEALPDAPLVAYAALPDVTLTDGASYVVPDAWSTPTTVAQAITGIPAGLDEASLQLDVVSGGVVMFGRSSFAQPPDATMSAARAMPTAGDALVASAAVRLGSQRQFRREQFTSWPAALTWAVDSATLPWVTAAPEVAPDATRMTWPESAGAGVMPELAVVQLRYPGAGDGVDTLWFVAGPYTPGTLALPALGSLEAARPAPANLAAPAGVLLLMVDDPAAPTLGYDELRPSFMGTFFVEFEPRQVLPGTIQQASSFGFG